MKKVVIKVSLHGEKSRPKAVDMLIQVMKAMVPCELLWNQLKPSAAKNKIKAMQIVARTRGVASIALDGQEKNQLVVSGDDDLDPVKLAMLLRRHLGIANIVSVDSSDSEKKESEKVETTTDHVYGGVPSFHVVELADNPGCNCSIM
ncbi:disease resistance protein RGA5-like [Coffea arabica]|uniref:Disease resistance protein RGA5-like n=1 Tax=Coffea arabica TaxID=13443 RepID=A0ABM4UAD9_COFAR